MCGALIYSVQACDVLIYWLTTLALSVCWDYWQGDSGRMGSHNSICRRARTNPVIRLVLLEVWPQPRVTGAEVLSVLPLPRLRFTLLRSPNVQAFAEMWMYLREVFPEWILSMSTNGLCDSYQDGFREISDFLKTEKELINVKNCSRLCQQRRVFQRFLTILSSFVEMFREKAHYEWNNFTSY